VLRHGVHVVRAAGELGRVGLQHPGLGHHHHAHLLLRDQFGLGVARGRLPRVQRRTRKSTAAEDLLVADRRRDRNRAHDVQRGGRQGQRHLPAGTAGSLDHRGCAGHGTHLLLVCITLEVVRRHLHLGAPRGVPQVQGHADGADHGHREPELHLQGGHAVRQLQLVHRLRDFNLGPGVAALQGLGREVGQLRVHVRAPGDRRPVLLHVHHHRHHLDGVGGHARHRIRMSRALRNHRCCSQAVFPGREHRRTSRNRETT